MTDTNVTLLLVATILFVVAIIVWLSQRGFTGERSIKLPVATTSRRSRRNSLAWRVIKAIFDKR